jgi:hypothetical protein
MIRDMNPDDIAGECEETLDLYHSISRNILYTDIEFL